MGIFEGHHTTVLGTTRTGKTYMALKHLEELFSPVFFFNTQAIDLASEKYNVKGFSKVNKKYDLDHLIRYLKSGGKLDYHPSPFLKYAKEELNYIVQYLFFKNTFTEEKPLLFCIDEAHDLAREGMKNDYICMIPCRGMAKGITGIFLTQRPALLDKTLLTQSNVHYIFRTAPADDAYFKTKGVEIEVVKNLLGEISEENKHNYVKFDGQTITGPFKEEKL